jgi:hypothetical protein
VLDKGVSRRGQTRGLTEPIGGKRGGRQSHIWCRTKLTRRSNRANWDHSFLLLAKMRCYIYAQVKSLSTFNVSKIG